MDTIRKIYVKFQNIGRGHKFQNMGRGQTMTEYALILAAVAVVVYVTYQTMGTDITTMVGKVDTALAGTAS